MYFIYHWPSQRLLGATCVLLRYSTAPPGSAITPIKLTQFGNAINNTVHGMLPSYNAHLPYRCSLNSTPAVNVSVSGYTCDAVVHLGGNRWKFTLRSDAWAVQRAFYQQTIGNKDIVIGIKAKRGGQAYALGTRARVFWFSINITCISLHTISHLCL